VLSGGESGTGERHPVVRDRPAVRTGEQGRVDRVLHRLVDGPGQGAVLGLVREDAAGAVRSGLDPQPDRGPEPDVPVPPDLSAGLAGAVRPFQEPHPTRRELRLDPEILGERGRKGLLLHLVVEEQCGAAGRGGPRG
jgi:hypothetical protein